MKCGETPANPIPRFLGRMQFLDSSGSLPVSIMNEEAGKVLYGKTPEELKVLLDRSKDSQEGDDGVLSPIRKHLNTRRLMTFMVSVRAQYSEYNEKVELKFQCTSAHNADESKDFSTNKLMIKMLKDMVGK